MNKSFNIKLTFSLLGLIFSINAAAQNQESIVIENKDNCGVVVPEQCKPGDIIIIINSSIQDLKFESNMLPDSAYKVIYYEAINQYIICHERMKFKLTVSGPNLLSEDIDIFDPNKGQLCYTVSANIARGTVNIITNPRNASVMFTELNNLFLSTNQPIKNVSGKYRVSIVKAQYKTVDTVIIIPRDAEKTYNIDFVPLFPKIKLNLSADDNVPFIKAPVIWIDSVKIELDSYVKAGLNQRSFFDDVEFLKFYEGNVIPVAEGTHDIKIEAESYIPYKTTINAQNGKTTTLSVNLEPIFGYLTFVDKELSEGATIIIDNQKIGKIPMFKVKTRVGNHKVRFEKPGFIPLKEEYTLAVNENQNTDFDVSMVVAKKISFDTEPSNASVFMDGTRIGFTPFSILVNAGKHEIVVRKNGYAGEKLIKLINEQTPDEETVKLILRSISPLDIRSEEAGLLVNLKGTKEVENIEIDSTAKTPATVSLPYGRYKISLTKNNKTVYRSTIDHSPDIIKRGKLPNYSRASFHVLTANYVNKDNFEGSFGRIHIFPGSGLSTSILNVDYRMAFVKVDSSNYSLKYQFKTLAPNIFFLNWDWRLGGSIIRQLDVNLLGRAKYTPGLKMLSVHLPGFSDVAMQNYFYGFEISTRLSYLNISFRYGRQINVGRINYWDNINGEYTGDKYLINEKRNIASIGITLNGKVRKSNNMLRLWHKPLIDLALRKSKVNDTAK
jgi:hypothetical protein